MEIQIDKITAQVRGALPFIAKYCEDNGYDDFDYGYLYQLNCWECEFFKDGTSKKKIVKETLFEIIEELTD